MESSNDLEWLLDCMVEYLKSPMWTTEICNFIDENCMLFAGDLEDENSFFQTDIHENFKKLVDLKLDTFCAEFGIEHEHFVEACSKITNRVHKMCIDQLVAVDNFLLFKKMMIMRNTQLNKLALAELQDYGEEIPQEANLQAQFDAEEAELQKAIELSKALADSAAPSEAQSKLEKELETKKSEKAS